MTRPNNKLVVKFNSAQEVLAVHEVARYLKLTEKQFMRMAIMKSIKEIVDAHNARLEQIKQQQAEVQDGRAASTVLDSEVNGSVPASQGDDSASSAQSESSHVVSGSQSPEVQLG